jgi:FMN phosphatase YigB (HAD superfamily)
VTSESPVIFLDDGGVMNDNARRGPEWQRLVGVYFAPRLGGAEAAWSQANLRAVERETERGLRVRIENPHLDLGADREESIDLWFTGMAREVGVAVPDDRADRLRLVEDAIAFITRRVRSDYPGAIEAIQSLDRVGYRLYTASGEHSVELDGYLTGMGVRACFQTLYGPDLVQTSKAGPHYYERMFAHAGIAPESAFVVDDTEVVLEWAASVGTRTVLCRPEPPRSARHGHIVSLAGLPEELERID